MERKQYIHLEKEINGMKLSFDFPINCKLQDAFDFTQECLKELVKISEENKAASEQKKA